MISLFLWLLALLATGLTWRQFTSVANRHRHRIIYSCGHRSSRPHFPLATGTGRIMVVFGLLALFGLLAGHRSDYRKIGSWHRSGIGLMGTGEAVQDRDYGTGRTIMAPVTAAFSAPISSIWELRLLAGGSLAGGSFGPQDRISVLRAGSPGQLIFLVRAGYSLQLIIVLISYIDCTGSAMIQSLWTLYRAPID